MLQCGRKAHLPKMTMASCQGWVAEGARREMWSSLGVQTRGTFLWVLSLDKYRYLESSQAACLISQELAFSKVQQDLLTTGSLALWLPFSPVQHLPSSCRFPLYLGSEAAALPNCYGYNNSLQVFKIKQQNEILP